VEQFKLAAPSIAHRETSRSDSKRSRSGYAASVVLQDGSRQHEDDGYAVECRFNDGKTKWSESYRLTIVGLFGGLSDCGDSDVASDRVLTLPGR
jgi:hypothetical protein